MSTSLKDSCIFCSKIKGSKSVIFETKSLMVFKDINPDYEFHLLICPKEHIEDYFEGPESLKICFKAISLAKKLAKLYRLKGYRIMINFKNFRNIFHAHLHLYAGKKIKTH